MIIDQFDTLYEDGKKQPRVLAIALHPFLVGHPFRAHYLERALKHIRNHDAVWITTGSSIVDWYRSKSTLAVYCLLFAAPRRHGILDGVVVATFSTRRRPDEG